MKVQCPECGFKFQLSKVNAEFTTNTDTKLEPKPAKTKKVGKRSFYVQWVPCRCGCGCGHRCNNVYGPYFRYWDGESFKSVSMSEAVQRFGEGAVSVKATGSALRIMARGRILTTPQERREHMYTVHDNLLKTGRGRKLRSHKSGRKMDAAAEAWLRGFLKSNLVSHGSPITNLLPY